MKTLHMLTLATFLVGGAATGFAATSNDSTGAPNPTATTGTSSQMQSGTTTTVQPGTTAPSGSTMTQNNPYAAPTAPPPGTHVGPTGSVTRDAANPKGAGKTGGGNK